MRTSRFAFIGEIVKRKPFIVAAISSLIAVLFASGYLKKKENELLGMVEPAGVVLASVDISEGDVLDDDSLVVSKAPRRFVQPGALEKIEEAAGNIAKIKIRAGSQITGSLVTPAGRDGGIAALIPAGKRAVTAPVDNIPGSHGLIRPGDSVDVLVTLDLTGDDVERRTTLTLIENVQVMAVGNRLYGAHEKTMSDGKKTFFGGAVPMSGRQEKMLVTLIVTPDDAQNLAFAMRSGSLAISIRPFGDDGDEEFMRPTTISSLIGMHGELMPAKKTFREYKGR